MRLGFTFVDLLTVAIVLVSVVFAVWRGFISETLSIVAWAAGLLAALYFGPYIVPLLAHLISPWWLAWITGYAVIFLVVLIPISLASFRLSETVRQSAVGPLDRALGAAFGAARGLAIVGGLYLLFSLVVPLRDHPEALRSARLLPLIQSSAEFLIALAPSEDRLVARKRLETGPAQNAVPGRAKPVPPTEPVPQHRAHKTYGASDRRALDRLIETTGHSGSKKP